MFKVRARRWRRTIASCPIACIMAGLYLQCTDRTGLATRQLRRMHHYCRARLQARIACIAITTLEKRTYKGEARVPSASRSLSLTYQVVDDDCAREESHTACYYCAHDGAMKRYLYRPHSCFPVAHGATTQAKVGESMCIDLTLALCQPIMIRLYPLYR
jgi:hypothetical protein